MVVSITCIIQVISLHYSIQNFIVDSESMISFLVRVYGIKNSFTNRDQNFKNHRLQTSEPTDMVEIEWYIIEKWYIYNIYVGISALSFENTWILYGSGHQTSSILAKIRNQRLDRPLESHWTQGFQQHQQEASAEQKMVKNSTLKGLYLFLTFFLKGI